MTLFLSFNPLPLMALFLSTQGVLIGLGLITAAILGYIYLGRATQKRQGKEKMLEKTSVNSGFAYVSAILIAIVVMSWTTASQTRELSSNLQDAWDGVYAEDILVEEVHKQKEMPKNIEPPKLETPEIKISALPEPEPDPNVHKSPNGTPDGTGEKPIVNGNGTGEYKLPPLKPIEPQKRDDDDVLVDIVEEMPRFCGCEDKKGSAQQKKECADKLMLSYLAKIVEYPNMAREMRYEGKVFIRFVVEKDASISNVEIVRDQTPGGGLAEAAKKAIVKMGKEKCWVAGMQQGRNVRVRLVVPIVFKLNG